MKNTKRRRPSREYLLRDWLTRRILESTLREQLVREYSQILPNEPMKRHGKACGLCQLAGQSLVTCKYSVKVGAAATL